MQIKPNHVSASLDQRIRDLLQQGRLPASAVPLEIEDDSPDDFDFSTPDGAAYGLNQWDTVSKHEIAAARSTLKRPTSPVDSAGEAGKSPALTAGQPQDAGNES